MNERDSILDALDSDGATYELEDGRTLRLSITPDEGASVTDDGDWYGALAPVREGYNDYGTRYERPAGFDGNAEILGIGRSYDRWWWQPPADVKRTDEGFAELRRSLIDLMEYGYRVVTLEVCQGTDAYRRPIVVGVASLGGVEPFPDAGYLREVVGDHLSELGIAEDVTHVTQTG